MNGSEHKQTQLPRKKNKKLKEQATSSMIYPLAIILSNKTIITSVARSSPGSKIPFNLLLVEASINNTSI